MTGEDLAALAARLAAGSGIAAKRDIGFAADRLGLHGQPVAVGDDCAALPDGDGYLLFAIEGFINEFVAADPWFAGWCGVMVNLSDIAAMGGRALAVVDAVWGAGEAGTEPILAGMRAASQAYGVPIVGGHTNVKTDRGQLSVAILGRATGLLTSFDARPGQVLVAAVDHRGSYREPFNNWQAALEAPPERLRADLELLPEIAEAGMACAAKDISQGGIIGTAIMLAECSGVSIEIDLNSIPVPDGVALERWLVTFPSFGFLLSVDPENVDTLLDHFAASDITAAAIGHVGSGHSVTVTSGGARALIRDHAAEPLMGLARPELVP